MCIVGKNGVGKTTLIRSIKNLTSTDIFSKTASPHIFNPDSEIIYVIDKTEYRFRYNSKLDTIDTKSIIDNQIKEDISVELPIPHGLRFNHFQKLGKIDEALRKCISLHEYSKPTELINFLSKVYNSTRFENLKEVHIKNETYYFILKDDDFYIREDYLSSGEYFVIYLYKLIQRKCKLIAIDEIDISLDASAQVNLINELREFCTKNDINIIFTTHSLALMKTLNDSELYYMENIESMATLEYASYNYVKSILFGFQGWDKYILTEDRVLKNYLEHLISHAGTQIFFRYIIIYIGGGQNVVDLMKRNESDKFLSSPENVISILDGDQQEISYFKNNNRVLFIPFKSVEKQLEHHHNNNELNFKLTVTGAVKKSHKNLHKMIIRERLMTDSEIFSYINDRNKEAVDDFRSRIVSYLTLE
ncbi:MAG: ATP-binding protein [Candidatus Thiodiazotropha sp. (ex Lucinoma borealis)]|nr:ATP-binding protein [Candidatus Thiodiazotropha sp. (ex Lucinoma borealis)]MCU7869339.1 ATP-binding protein [Candidatus Thiodiazotropha sp. (ex Lucinoma borealis)]